MPSCPALCRASTSSLLIGKKDVDGRETLVLAIRRRRIALPGHDGREVAGHDGVCISYRLFLIGIVMSSIFSSRTGSFTAQARFGSTLTRKWYMLCSA